MEPRNLTLSLPAELVKRAKIYAAQHDTTINSVVRELLEGAVSGKERNRSAVAQFLAIGKRVRTRAAPGRVRREDLHERW